MAGPEGVLLERRLLPGRIADDRIEAGPVTEEYLGEGDWEVKRVKPGERVLGLAVVLRALQAVLLGLPVFEDRGQLLAV